MNDPLAIAYDALKSRLYNADSLWSTRVFTETALPTADRPYLLVMFSGGGEINALQRKDAEFLITVKGVADTLKTSLQVASAIGELLNDHGTQDNPNDSVVPVTPNGWVIQTITQERRVQMTETFENVEPVYHAGHQFRIRMEKP